MEVVKFYFHHHGTTAALPADDLADIFLQICFHVLFPNILILFGQVSLLLVLFFIENELIVHKYISVQYQTVLTVLFRYFGFFTSYLFLLTSFSIDTKSSSK